MALSTGQSGLRYGLLLPAKQPAELPGEVRHITDALALRDAVQLRRDGLGQTVLEVAEHDIHRLLRHILTDPGLLADQAHQLLHACHVSPFTLVVYPSHDSIVVDRDVGCHAGAVSERATGTGRGRS